MMKRSVFRDEFARTMRLVLQKHEREMIARAEASQAHQFAKEGPFSGYLAARAERADKALQEANVNLDASIDAAGAHLLDAIEQVLEP